MIRLLEKLKNSELFITSLFSIALKVLSALSGFLLTFFVAKLLHINEAGQFFTSFSLIILLSALCRVGLDNIVLRHTGESHTAHESNYRATVTTAIGITLLASVTVLTILLLIIQNSNYLFFEGVVNSKTVIILGTSVILFGVNTILGMAFQGKKWLSHSVFMITLGTNLLFVFSIYLITPTNVEHTLFLYMIALALCTIYGITIWQYRFGFSLQNIDFERIKRAALPLSVIVIIGQMFHWGPQIVIGLYGSAAEVAQYTATYRTAFLISFVLNAVNIVVAPRFAARYRDNDLAGLEIIAKQAVKLTIVMVLPIYLLVMLAPNMFMAIFGDAYQGQSFSLRILATAQVFNVFSGSVAFLLTMTGNERDLRNSMLVTGTFFVIGVILIVPKYGINGAAINTAVISVMLNVINLIYVKSRLGFNTLIFWRLSIKRT